MARLDSQLHEHETAVVLMPQKISQFLLNACMKYDFICKFKRGITFFLLAFAVCKDPDFNRNIL